MASNNNERNEHLALTSNQAIQLIARDLDSKLELSFKQEVWQYKDVFEKRVVNYRVRRVVNPFEFYLEFADGADYLDYEPWHSEMQEVYDNRANRRKMQVVKGIPLVGRCYACLDYKDNKWHRVRLHRTKPKVNTVVVFYLDLCKLQETTTNRLLELADTFADNPAAVFRAYLHDVFPAEPKETYQWSKDACDFFQKLVKGKEFSGISMTRSYRSITKGLPDFITTDGVVLVENLPGTEKPKPEASTLNAMMVEAGYGVAYGPCAGSPYDFQRDGYVPFFDQEECDLLFGIDDVSGSDSSTPVDPSSPSGPLPPSSLPSGDSTPVNDSDDSGEGGSDVDLESQEADPEEENDELDTISTTDNTNEIRKLEEFYKSAIDKFPQEFADRVAAVDITYAQAPCFMVLQLNSKKSELRAMHEGIGRAVEEEDALEDGKPGMFVAVYLADEEDKTGESGVWQRGIIKSVVEDDKTAAYQVLLTDYGNEVVVGMDTDSICALPQYFQTIPSFGIRVHLAGESLIPYGSSVWTKESRTDFAKYIYTWKDMSPRYFTYRPRGAKVLQMDHYFQQLRYDEGSEEWQVDEGQSNESLEVIDEMKDHPMLSSLFVSFGVELVYEIIIKDCPNWHFEDIADNLIEAGHATKKPKKTTNRRNLDISEAATSSVVEQDIHEIVRGEKVVLSSLMPRRLKRH